MKRCDIRLRRTRNVRAMVNELQAPNPFTPAQRGDPYSGTGRLFPQVAYTAAFMKKICEALGPLESFEPAGMRRPYGGAGMTEAWDVKWQTRTDAVNAKLALSFLPFIGWTWSHEGRSYDRPSYANGSVETGHYDRPLKSSGDPPTLIRKLSKVGVWGAVDALLPEKITEEFPPLSSVQPSTYVSGPYYVSIY